MGSCNGFVDTSSQGRVSWLPKLGWGMCCSVFSSSLGAVGSGMVGKRQVRTLLSAKRGRGKGSHWCSDNQVAAVSPEHNSAEEGKLWDLFHLLCGSASGRHILCTSQNGSSLAAQIAVTYSLSTWRSDNNFKSSLLRKWVKNSSCHYICSQVLQVFLIFLLLTLNCAVLFPAAAWVTYTKNTWS